MKKILLLAVFALAAFVIYSYTNRQDDKAFKKEALENKMVALDGSSIAFKDILKKYKGKTIVIDVWASWCSDCIKGMPKVKALQTQFPDVTYLFVSMDKTPEAWKKGIEKYEVVGEHYMATDGMKGVFGKSIDLNWIPRYMVIDKKGKIALFRAIEADDTKLIETLKTLK
ncbi:TlpA family protein disulfide reductase [Flavobacterium saliperosum]|uniref:Thiol-disulfide isomerase or thioredoxin n=2 Tax=Flavobacterium saliperosum TaxID=329186 RepID=A0A1G4W1T0_9FLAO|nr:TlpA disulfide reductase family protein [Flavobacterium saliperosum]SCX15328.1 Thiol-disulfide isomerase or thioredoxin [Flavobacterium saliperosum]